MTALIVGATNAIQIAFVGLRSFVIVPFRKLIDFVGLHPDLDCNKTGAKSSQRQRVSFGRE